MSRVLRMAASVVWGLGDVAGWLTRHCYRIAGRLNGYSYEISRRVGG